MMSRGSARSGLSFNLIVVLMLTLGLLTVASAGCDPRGARSPGANGKKLQPKNPFPARAALEQLAASPAKTIPSRKVATEPSWVVDPSASAEPAPVEVRFGELTRNGSGSASGGLQMSRELRCAARELAKFRAEHDADADERLQRFVVGACGFTSPFVVPFSIHADEIPKDVSDAEIFAAWKGKIEIPAPLQNKQVGIWFARKDTRAVLMIVAGQEIGAASASVPDASNRVIVRGIAAASTEHVLGLVNQGREGVATCVPDPAVALPQYSFTCPMAAGDPWTWIQVSAQPASQLLMHASSLLLVRRDAKAPIQLEPGIASSSAKSASSQAEITSAILEGVNRARTSSRLAPLTLAPKQSMVNERLAPHFFEAETTNEASTSDTVALGLLAGYEIEGTIRTGNFFSSLLSGAGDPARWLDSALDLPMGRHTLLEPDARQIAIGAASPGDVGGLGVLVTTYAFFGGSDHRADATRILQRVVAERAARRLAPPTTLGVLPNLAAQAKLVNAGQRDAMDALELALDSEAQRLQRNVNGWVVLTSNLDKVPLPPELFGAAPPAVSVEVTHFRPEGSAWGMYLVYFVAAGVQAAPQGQVATIDGARSSM